MEKENYEMNTGNKEEREFLVDGNILKETKSKTFIEGHYNGKFGDSTTIIEYTRSIENSFGAKRSVKITEKFINGYITGVRTEETEGDLNTSEEMQQFENDWDKFTSIHFLRTHPDLTHISQIEQHSAGCSKKN